MTIFEIARFVCERYPNSCIAANVGVNYVDRYDKELLIEMLVEFFSYDILNLCGCGIPENTWEVIHHILSIRLLAREMDYSEIKKMYKDELHLDADDDLQHGSLQFILYILDDCGLVEHGSSVGGCWLTELGKMYLTVLDEWFDLAPSVG